MFRYETEHVYLSVYACYHHREFIVDMEMYVCVCDVLQIIIQFHVMSHFIDKL